VSSFLTAHEHIIGYSVPSNNIRTGERNVTVCKMQTSIYFILGLKHTAFEPRRILFVVLRASEGSARVECNQGSIRPTLTRQPAQLTAGTYTSLLAVLVTRLTCCFFPTTTILQPFYGPLSGTTRVSRYQKKIFTHSYLS